jgi:hypothetical protein
MMCGEHAIAPRFRKSEPRRLAPDQLTNQFKPTSTQSPPQPNPISTTRQTRHKLGLNKISLPPPHPPRKPPHHITPTPHLAWREYTPGYLPKTNPPHSPPHSLNQSPRIAMRGSPSAFPRSPAPVVSVACGEPVESVESMHMRRPPTGLVASPTSSSHRTISSTQQKTLPSNCR